MVYVVISDLASQTRAKGSRIASHSHIKGLGLNPDGMALDGVGVGKTLQALMVMCMLRYYRSSAQKQKGASLQAL